MNGELAQQIEKEVVDELLSEKAVKVGFKRLSENAVLPTKAHAADSGFDLVASEDVLIAPGETVVVPTDIAVQLPAGYEAQVRPRSGVTAKTKLRVQLGTIDNGYSGAIGVIVDNIRPISKDTDYIATELNGETSTVYGNVSEGSYIVRKGDRIAQLVIQRLPEVSAVEVSDVCESERGEGGFGSSGFVADAIRRSYE